jgi:hypothetical protein
LPKNRTENNCAYSQTNMRLSCGTTKAIERLSTTLKVQRTQEAARSDGAHEALADAFQMQGRPGRLSCTHLASMYNGFIKVCFYVKATFKHGTAVHRDNTLLALSQALSVTCAMCLQGEHFRAFTKHDTARHACPARFPHLRADQACQYACVMRGIGMHKVSVPVRLERTER